jgi:small subunit ribosomal protein S5
MNSPKKKKRKFYIINKKFAEKIIKIRRVTKAVTGGKKLTYQALVIVGDKRRRVGIGIGRAGDVSKAIEKATAQGKKHMVFLPLTKRSSIPYVIKSKFGACKILLRPASEGTGIIAGGTLRTVLELGGVKNIVAKQFGSSNNLNNAKATISALIMLKRRIKVAKFLSIQKAQLYNKIMKSTKNEHITGKKESYFKKK